ncbi:MAG: hypothetical protein ACOY3L_02550 [Pseudomonadota bacterium]
MRLSQFESDVLHAIVRDRFGESSKLMAQIDALSLERKEMTGVGMYLYFQLTDEDKKVPEVQDEIISSRVGASLPQLHNDIGFVLYIEKGVIKMLECYTVDEPWPTDISTYNLVTYQIPS